MDSSSADRGSGSTLFVGGGIGHFQIKLGISVPYLGRVISTVPGYPQWYNVIYDTDPAVYVYKLLEDYAAGDLEIIPEGNKRQLLKLSELNVQLILFRKLPQYLV